MTVFQPPTASCFVFTFKEGLLSAVAHDLKLEVTRFEIEFDKEHNKLKASFDPSSLRVVCAMHEGLERPGALSDKDKREIEEQIHKTVLEPDWHPHIRFTCPQLKAVVTGFTASGSLEIKGVQRPIQAEIRPVGPHWVSEVKLNQTDFGIRPFSAMLGTLKIKSEVVVRVLCPQEG